MTRLLYLLINTRLLRRKSGGALRYGRLSAAINGSDKKRFAAVALTTLWAIATQSATLYGPAAAADDETVIVALGDSLTAGYGVVANDSFTVRLEAALRDAGMNARVVNAGVSGDTTAGGLARLDWVLADAPDLVIVELGSNDALRGLDPAAMEANLDAILTSLAAKDIPAVLAGMLAPPNLGRAYGEAFQAVYPRLAKRHGVVFYPFFLDGVAAQPALNQPDGIHPNPAGVRVIVERFTPYVLRALADVEHPSQAQSR
jgi:acyl-CoA thioesterase-1